VSKVTAPPNSVAAALKVMVWLAALRKVMGAEKDHAAEVVLFVHEPVAFQLPAAPLVTYPLVAMLTFPFTATVALLDAYPPRAPRLSPPRVEL